MIWATVSSWSCFYWLYRASPSLAANNIINLISALTIWWCPCIESCIVGRQCLLWPVHSLGKTKPLDMVVLDSPISPGISPYAIVTLLHHIAKQFFLVGNIRRLLRPEWYVHHPGHKTVSSLWSLNWFFTQNLLTDLMLSFLKETKIARSFTTNFIQS